MCHTTSHDILSKAGCQTPIIKFMATGIYPKVSEPMHAIMCLVTWSDQVVSMLVAMVASLDGYLTLYYQVQQSCSTFRATGPELPRTMALPPPPLPFLTSLFSSGTLSFCLPRAAGLDILLPPGTLKIIWKVLFIECIHDYSTQ